MSPRSLAFCSVFGALALAMPVVFHVLHLGHVFMPMYLPLVTLAFLVRARDAALCAAITPLLSAALTGMPPFFPPVALMMAVELGAMAFFIGTLHARKPRWPVFVVLAAALLFGRVLYVVGMYAVALLIELPAAFVAGLSLLSGWPGVVLMLLVVPPTVLLLERRSPARLPT